MKKCYNCGNILGDADMFCENAVLMWGMQMETVI